MFLTVLFLPQAKMHRSCIATLYQCFLPHTKIIVT